MGGGEQALPLRLQTLASTVAARPACQGLQFSASATSKAFRRPWERSPLSAGNGQKAAMARLRKQDKDKKLAGGWWVGACLAAWLPTHFGRGQHMGVALALL